MIRHQSAIGPDAVALPQSCVAVGRVDTDAPFEQGRKQLHLFAGLEVTIKSVERNAEAIGADIAEREQQQIQRAVQLDLPLVIGEPIPIMYIQMDGTGVPVVKKETLNRKGKTEGQRAHTREVKLGCVFTQTGIGNPRWKSAKAGVHWSFDGGPSCFHFSNPI